ncbi:MAG: hypothetical protein NZT61_06275 [Deltaproteobacteria bacterium]|nr:hypothetical protein [Deltaproteobacteria bacterium]
MTTGPDYDAGGSQRIGRDTGNVLFSKLQRLAGQIIELSFRGDVEQTFELSEGTYATVTRQDENTIELSLIVDGLNLRGRVLNVPDFNDTNACQFEECLSIWYRLSSNVDTRSIVANLLCYQIDPRSSKIILITEDPEGVPLSRFIEEFKGSLRETLDIIELLTQA